MIVSSHSLHRQGLLYCIVLLTYRGSKTGSSSALARVTSEIIPVIKPMSQRPEDEGTTFAAFMDTCILLV